VCDEGAIRDAWQKGDMTTAACAAITHLGPEILQYLRTVLPNPAAADDAFSFFCERLWSSLPRFEGRSTFRTWAYVIARRASVDVLRAEGPRLRRQAPLTESKIAELAEQVRSSTLPLFKTAGRTAVMRLRDELPREDRMLLMMRIDQSLAWDDIARIFLEREALSDGEVRREAARLRKRYQLVRTRLRKRAEAASVMGDDSGWTVHVFLANGRFRSDTELRAFLDPAYTEDGDLVPSQFMRETGLREYEPACIERVYSPSPLRVHELVRATSYADQWLHRLEASLVGDSAICVFGPNVLDHPKHTSIRYVGGFPYRAPRT
jgi:RNA polymerase sigma-70 factor (ECF subfamily)